ncbi:3-deoxy-manno-octulosonate cytidylyltransferase [Halorhodospira halophila]|uniref:3-deoxy-manno-octulosonate cytidylyltransferase n=1 Tax=Halorhodospira halophila (strain DSM 244 / SL1) TaxID=349124 RepID=KDSB_HALHL|nr:3-deoxy-manno-octulosonate cytidylyltransferase [Halorhodospira halophila]A1WWF7.1 RecName: Full=3-deoxy-manno-octulosonate cytidylyltransferase; AltName: Full=CMP-2-keto-3-deoxyoctulosonic acid synthase; Short=CKS; Short=CMP-KDO synthase [Halorhodospira halophila SL1]ABM62019.1 3-deoxy-D-manno-octulosonate cytidylyltransferase [Halorhodospira halophila SL1]MBK1728440.1 3-deoxy-manno-octulosonate cytidylyltransferase [Halorhodospira halophila]
MSTPAFTVVIPARYGASRLPGKPLADLLGEPVVQHVYRRAVESGAARVVVATDDARIESACRDFGAEVLLTAPDHPTGTDRIAEVVDRLALVDEAIVVNLQGDEPLMPPELVALVAERLDTDPDAAIATLATPVTAADELFEPSVVKVVRDHRDHALYFSRAPVPWDRDRFDGIDDGAVAAGGWLRHLGLYAYRAAFLRRFPGLEPAPPERLESLEQLRALWHGFAIQVAATDQRPGPGVDTPADLEAVARRLQSTR